jgi:ADP-ribosylglycohydrolase
MRVAPVGLIDHDAPFDLGSKCAALTHGHPSGHLPAGFLAAMMTEVMRGRSIEQGIERASTKLGDTPGHEETRDAVRAALALVAQGSVTPERLETLGGGWTGEEALAIALASVLSAHTFEEAVLRAVNHSGDSDSTGSIAGQIFGLLVGVEWIPERWLAQLELRREIETIAEDLYRAFCVSDASDDEGVYDWERYPGW